MPLYEYVCTACEHEFEHLARSMTLPGKPPCPACGSTDVDRKPSAFNARQGKIAESSAGPCGQCCSPDGTCPLN